MGTCLKPEIQYQKANKGYILLWSSESQIFYYLFFNSRFWVLWPETSSIVLISRQRRSTGLHKGLP